MRFEDHLSKEQKQQLNNVAKKKERKRNKKNLVKKIGKKLWDYIVILIRERMGHGGENEINK